MNSYGAVIKAKRKYLQLSQKEVCKGICAMSHLSKIENAEIVPSAEIREKLIERLKLENYENRLSRYEGLIHSFHRQVVSMNRTEAYAIYQKLHNHHKRLRFSSLHLDYSIVIYGYYVLMKKESLKKAMDSHAYIMDLKKHLSDEQAFYFQLYESMSLFKMDIDRGIAKLTDVLRIESTGYVNFQLMCLHTGKRQYNKALRYADEAVEKFLREGCMRGVVATIHYIGTLHLALKEYDVAEVNYKNAIKLVLSAKSSDDYINSYLFFANANLAEIAIKNNLIDQVEGYARKAIACAQTSNGNYYGVLPYFHMAYVCSRKNMRKEAEAWLEEGRVKLPLSMTQDRELEKVYYKKYQYMMYHYDYLRHDAYCMILKEAESIALDHHLGHMLDDIYRELKEHYVMNRQYKKALDVTES